MATMRPFVAVLKHIGDLLAVFVQRPAARALAMSLLPVLATGVLFYHFVEEWSWVDSLYFCVVSLTTVGLGDVAPETDGAKLFTIAYILIGLGITIAFLTEIGQAIMETLRSESEVGHAILAAMKSDAEVSEAILAVLGTARNDDLPRAPEPPTDES